MDFNIDIYTEYLDGRCIGNNYFTLSDYMSATLDFNIILKGVLSVSEIGQAALSEFTDTDYSLLADMLRTTIHGDANVEVEFYTYNYYSGKKLGFNMYVPTSVYNLDPRVHGNVNQTFINAMRYLKAASSAHTMQEVLFDGAKSLIERGSKTSFSSLLLVEVSEIKFDSFMSNQHGATKEWGTFVNLNENENGGIGGDSSSSSSSGGSRGGGGDDDGSEHVSFVTDGDEEIPTLSKTLLTYANIKMGASVFFALSVMVYFVSRVRARRAASVEDPSSSLLDVSSSHLLLKKDKQTNLKKKKKKLNGNSNSSRGGSGDGNETDELLGDDIDDSARASRDVEEGEGGTCGSDTTSTSTRQLVGGDDHKSKSKSKRGSKEKYNRESNKKTRKSSQNY